MFNVRTLQMSIAEDGSAVELKTTDDSGRANEQRFDPEALAELMRTGFAVSAQWDHGHPQQAKTAVDLSNASPAVAAKLEALRGRTDRETALRISVGPVAVTLLLPLHVLLEAMSDLQEAVEQTTPLQ